MGNGYKVGRYGQSSIARSLNSTFRGGFPDRARVKLVYPDNIALSSSTTPGAYVYRGNGPFDPDQTGTGMQPPYYDDWTFVYNRYRVWGAKLTLSLQSPSATTQGRFVLGARRSSTTPTSSPTLLGFAAMEYTKSGLVGPNGLSGLDTNPRAGLGTSVQLSVSTPQFKGVTVQGFIGREDLASVYNTTPADPWYFVISCINLDSSSTTVYRGTICIEYDVEFFDRVEDSLDLSLERAIKIRQESKSRRERKEEEISLLSPVTSEPPRESKLSEEPVLVTRVDQPKGPIYRLVNDR
jgi:hypothetical protein